MNKVLLAVIAVTVMGAGCAQSATVNTNATVNREAGGTTENVNAPGASGSLNVNAEVDAILKDADDEQVNESSGDESDLTTAETLDLNAMIGAPGNY